MFHPEDKINVQVFKEKAQEERGGEPASSVVFSLH